MSERFRRFARVVSDLCGTWQAFFVNVALILAWLAVGPLCAWSEGWQLLVNTGTTVVTYLLVFLVMATQNRDAAQLTLKMDEVIRALPHASNRMIALETLSDAEFQDLRRRVDQLAERG